MHVVLQEGKFIVTMLERTRKQIKILGTIVSNVFGPVPSFASAAVEVPDLNIDTFYSGTHLYIFYGAI